MPGACCTRGLVCKRWSKGAHEHTGTAGALRHSLRNGLTAYAALSPETNSSCLRRRRLDGSSIRLDQIRHRQLGTSHGCRDHTVLPYASAPYVMHAGFRSQDKPALRLHLRADAAASTASHPAFVTIAIRPSCRDETGELIELICPTS